MKSTRLLSIVVLLASARVLFHAWQLRQAPAASAPVKKLKYQCPMHPQIIRDEPGDCPICHMHLQLVQLDSDPSTGSGQAPASDVPGHAPFALSEERRQLIGVRSEAAQVRTVLRTLRLPGRVGENPGSILAQALEMDGTVLQRGLDAQVWVTGEGAREARVVSVDRALDAFSRTFGVRLALQEASGPGFRPGVYCDVRVALKLGQGVTVPKEAVLDTGDHAVVFVQEGGGRFEPRNVEVGKEGDDYVEIRKGVAAGEQVVTSANFLIDSEKPLPSCGPGLWGRP